MVGKVGGGSSSGVMYSCGSRTHVSTSGRRDKVTPEPCVEVVVVEELEVDESGRVGGIGVVVVMVVE